MDERTGRRVFFNSVIAAFTGWNDSRLERRRLGVWLFVCPCSCFLEECGRGGRGAWRLQPREQACAKGSRTLYGRERGSLRLEEGRGLSILSEASWFRMLLPLEAKDILIVDNGSAFR